MWGPADQSIGPIIGRVFPYNIRVVATPAAKNVAVAVIDLRTAGSRRVDENGIVEEGVPN